jgi:hypothetical protein
MHLYNEKKMHWYLAEYGPIGKKFFGFFVNKVDGIASGFAAVMIYSALKKRWRPGSYGR